MRLIKASLTGKDATYYGLTLPLAKPEKHVSYPDIAEVDGTCYYVHDFGGVWVGSRAVWGEDYGGNLHHATRVAPTSRMGVAAPTKSLPIRAVYSAPEVFFDEEIGGEG